jgi:DNA-binding transcriptional LysR family regulator
MDTPSGSDTPRTTDAHHCEDDVIPLGIDLRHLRYFVTLSEELHFRRAAERLHISQPPLSQATRRLEEKLGVQLLRRTSRQVTLTEAGRVFAEDARKVIAAFELAVAETRRAGSEVGALRIGCMPHLPMDDLLRFRSLLEAHEPSMETEVRYLSTLQQIRALRMGELDLGIFYEGADLDDLVVEPLWEGEPVVLCVAPDHKLASRQTLGPDDLRDEDLVVLRQSLNPPLLERFLSEIEMLGYRFRSVREASGTEARDLLLAVASGSGVTFLPPSIKESTAQPIVSRHAIDPPLSLPDAVLAWRADASGQLLTVIEGAREVARELRRAQGQRRAGATP